MTDTRFIRQRLDSYASETVVVVTTKRQRVTGALRKVSNLGVQLGVVNGADIDFFSWDEIVDVWRLGYLVESLPA